MDSELKKTIESAIKNKNIKKASKELSRTLGISRGKSENLIQEYLDEKSIFKIKKIKLPKISRTIAAVSVFAAALFSAGLLANYCNNGLMTKSYHSSNDKAVIGGYVQEERPFPQPAFRASPGKSALEMIASAKKIRFEYSTNMKDLSKKPEVVLVGMAHTQQFQTKTIQLINEISDSGDAIFVEGMDNYAESQNTYKIISDLVDISEKELRKSLKEDIESNKIPVMSRFYNMFSKTRQVYGNDTKELIIMTQLILDTEDKSASAGQKTMVATYFAVDLREDVFLESLLKYVEQTRRTKSTSTAFQWIGASHLEDKLNPTKISSKATGIETDKSVIRDYSMKMVKGLGDNSVSYLILYPVAEDVVKEMRDLLDGKQGTTSAFQEKHIKDFRKAERRYRMQHNK